MTYRTGRWYEKIDRQLGAFLGSVGADSSPQRKRPGGATPASLLVNQTLSRELNRTRLALDSALDFLGNEIGKGNQAVAPLVASVPGAVGNLSRAAVGNLSSAASSVGSSLASSVGTRVGSSISSVSSSISSAFPNASSLGSTVSLLSSAVGSSISAVSAVGNATSGLATAVAKLVIDLQAGGTGEAAAASDAPQYPQIRRGASAAAQIEPSVRAAFEALDLDGSGDIDAHELGAALKQLGVTVPSRTQITI